MTRIFRWRAKPGPLWVFELGPLRIHKAYWCRSTSEEGWEISVYLRRLGCVRNRS